MKEKMQMVAFEMISKVGMAKSNYIMAIEEAKQGKYDEAAALIKEGQKWHAEASHAHLDLVQAEAKGEDLPFSLILMHAEDQMLSNETIKILAETTIDLYKEIDSLKS